jgi:hypothetical protein
MPRTNLKNEFRKYWHPVFKDWHQNLKGVYHVSSVGCSHQDLDYEEHSGPCLRQTAWEYTDPLSNSDATDGNLEEGHDHHKKLQKIIKKWKPNTVIEKPLAKIFERDGRKILLVGSIDVEYKHLFDMEKDTSKTKKKVSIWDIKTASDYTLPASRSDKNPTHFDQTKIYGTMDALFELHPEHNGVWRVKLIYINKHNKATYTQRERFKLDEGVDKLGDCVDRCFYLDECLEKGEIPAPEPMHWCKYCKYLKRCIAVGDVEPIMTKRNVLKGLKVIENS